MIRNKPKCLHCGRALRRFEQRMKECGCRVYELCPQCAPTPEHYERAARYTDSAKRVDQDAALEWLKQVVKGD